MLSTGSSFLTNFFLAGINYKKSDAAIRGKFAIHKDQYANLVEKAAAYQIDEFFVLSTCNRTEIYGIATNAETLCEFLCSETKGRVSDFMEAAYVENGERAVTHLFEVAAGLDSQILGDYEIVGQLKDAIKFSKKMNCMHVFTERMVNAALQSSKNIRTNTRLSGGTISVSFAAVQYIKEHIDTVANKKILLIGTGKIGRNTCKNIVNYLDTRNITLINRTEEKAICLATEMGIKSAPINSLEKEVKAADIILVASNDTKPVIIKDHFNCGHKKLIVDLSIPYNADPSVNEHEHITLVNVDELSKIKDETLHMRIAEVPKARNIIEFHIAEFFDWNNMRTYVPVLKAVKNKLQQLHNCDMFNSYTSNISHTTVYQNDGEHIQKVINGMAVKMRSQNDKGCLYIEALNEYIARQAN